jgi:hypothetical protein
VTDDLRAALAAADPVRSADLDPSTSPRARELLERTMATPTTDLRTDLRTDLPGHRRTTPSRRPWLAAAAAAVVLAGGGAAYLSTTGEQDAPAGGGQLALDLPAGDPATQSCLPVSADAVAALPVAFAGTATAVGEGEVRLEVDRWYRGGDAATVVLTAPGGDAPALVGATDFQQGEQYLVSADQGTVSVCGLTGPASPELQAVYDEAFPG